MVAIRVAFSKRVISDGSRPKPVTPTVFAFYPKTRLPPSSEASVSSLGDASTSIRWGSARAATPTPSGLAGTRELDKYTWLPFTFDEQVMSKSALRLECTPCGGQA